MSDLGSITERLALVIEAQKTWGEHAARELAEQLGVRIPETAHAPPSVRGEQHGWPRLMFRMPPDVKNWIATKAAANGSSQNSEIVRAVRVAMKADQSKPTTGQSLPAHPAAGPHEPALQGGPEIQAERMPG